MKYTDVVIRRQSDVDLLDPRVVAAFHNVDKKTEIPIYYKYCQDQSNAAEVSQDQFIGKALRVRENVEGDIVCDVIINDALSLAENFQGVIDNFVVSVAPDKNGNQRPTLLHFFIYDKNFKAQVDQRMSELKALRSKQSPVEVEYKDDESEETTEETPVENQEGKDE